MRRNLGKDHFCKKNQNTKTTKCNSMEAVSLQLQEQVMALMHVLFRKEHWSAQETQCLVVVP